MTQRERVAETIVLVEDTVTQNFVRRYLQRCWRDDYVSKKVHFKKSASAKGSAEHFVRANIADEVRSCRRRIRAGPSTMLIVVMDADSQSTQHERSMLRDELSRVNLQWPKSDEPIAILIPKRNLETWIRALLGNAADEETDYSKRPFTAPPPKDIQTAAEKLFDNMRASPELPPAWPQSLRDSIPEWRKIELT